MNHATPTLARMPQAEKTPPPTDTTHADPFAWDPDPLVLVSRRPRILYFPRVLAQREATDRDYQQWREPGSTALHRQEEQMAVGAGVTFLGCYTTSWADLETARGHATAVPNSVKMILVEPFTRAHDLIARNNRDPSSGRLIPTGVQAVYHRILRHHQREAQDGRCGALNPWATQDGFDAPELQMLRLSEVFSQRTEAGQHAHATVTTTIKYLRRNPHESVTPLGALHDYAIRSRAGAAVLEECRRWAVAKKIG